MNTFGLAIAEHLLKTNSVLGPVVYVSTKEVSFRFLS